ncbi:MAG TPA: hypothetical protein VK308_03650 [Pyrinomonadaceae bacterium]|nr:hypothetical protein [Pyrinomonadaceae bacterium]
MSRKPTAIKTRKATANQTLILPDSANVIAVEDIHIFSELVQMKNQIEEMNKNFDEAKTVAKLIVEKARACANMDKTFVLDGTEITYTTRRNFTFSEKVQNAEETLKRAEEAVKRLKEAEINNGTAKEGTATTFLSISSKANLRFDHEANHWISTFKTNAKTA